MIVFLTELDAAMTARVTPLLGAHRVVRSLAELRAATGTMLFSFSTSIIVPPDILRRFDGAAYNLHAASPEYPGRDPHHWAVYDGATRYGATLHQMTPRVDDGPIIDVEWFDVEAGTMPPQLLAAANAAALRLLARCAPLLQRSGALVVDPDLRWTGVKRTRADFLAMCRLPPDISAAEFVRRVRAFDSPNHDNLSVTLHGRTFRLERP